MSLTTTQSWPPTCKRNFPAAYGPLLPYLNVNSADLDAVQRLQINKGLVALHDPQLSCRVVVTASRPAAKGGTPGLQLHDVARMIVKGNRGISDVCTIGIALTLPDQPLSPETTRDGNRGNGQLCQGGCGIQHRDRYLRLQPDTLIRQVQLDVLEGPTPVEVADPIAMAELAQGQGKVLSIQRFLTIHPEDKAKMVVRLAVIRNLTDIPRSGVSGTFVTAFLKRQKETPAHRLVFLFCLVRKV